MNIFTVKPGVEQIASSECLNAGIKTDFLKKGLLCTTDINISKDIDLCFSSWQFSQVHKIDFTNFNVAIRDTSDWYCESIRSERIEKSWPLIYLTFSENGFTLDLTKSTGLIDKLKAKVSRIAKLATIGYPEMHVALNGLFIIETEENGLFISRDARFYGQRRMKHDPAAPSRSYLKVEEAFTVFGREPSSDEIVVDLGAAPGGWSYAAAKRGATVFAIDNGPLKKGAAKNKLINHIREDAFFYKPETPVDWLFCDMVEDPFRVIKLIKTWLKKKLCRYVIINCKYGFADPFRILMVAKSTEGFKDLAEKIICRHLFHDRDEVTIMMKTRS